MLWETSLEQYKQSQIMITDNDVSGLNVVKISYLYKKNLSQNLFNFVLTVARSDPLNQC